MAFIIATFQNSAIHAHSKFYLIRNINKTWVYLVKQKVENMNSSSNYEKDLANFQNADSYVLNQLVYHLFHGGQHERIFRILLSNKAWIQAKSERIEDLSLLLNDIQLAISLFHDPLDSDQTLTLLQLTVLRLLLKNQIENYSDIDLQTLVLTGEIQRALNYAKQHKGNAYLSALYSIYEMQREMAIIDTDLVQELLVSMRNGPNSTEKSKLMIPLIESLFVAGKKEVAESFLAPLLSELFKVDAYFDTTITNRGHISIGVQGVTPDSQKITTRFRSVPDPIVQAVKLIELMAKYLSIEAAEKLVNILPSPVAQFDLWLSLSDIAAESGDKSKSKRYLEIAESGPYIMDETIDQVYGLAILATREDKGDSHWIENLVKRVDALCNEQISILKLDFRETFGRRSENIDQINTSLLVENLCHVVLCLNNDKFDQIRQYIIDRAIAISNEINMKDEMNLMMGEVPIVYIEQYQNGVKTESDAYFEGREDALVPLVLAFARLGNWEEARTLMSQVSHDRTLQKLNFYLSIELVNHNQPDDAIALLRGSQPLPLVKSLTGPEFVFLTHFNKDVYELDEYNTHSFVLSLIVDHYLKINNVEQARSIVDELHISGNSNLSEKLNEHFQESRELEFMRLTKSQLLSSIAYHYARTNSPSLAKETLEEIRKLRFSGPSQRERFFQSLMTLIVFLADNEMWETTYKLVERFQLGVYRRDAIKNIAERQWLLSGTDEDKTDAYEHMLSLVNELSQESGNQHEDGLGILSCAKAFSRMGLEDDAMQVLMTASSLLDKEENKVLKALSSVKFAETMYAIAPKPLSENMQEPINQMFQMALNQSGSIYPRWLSIDFFQEVAESLVRCEQLENARKVLGYAIHELRLRYLSHAHCAYGRKLVRSMILCKDFERALGVAATMIDDPRYQQEYMGAIVDIISALAEEHLFEDAIKLTFVISDAYWASQAIMNISIEQIRIGAVTEAKKGLLVVSDLLSSIADVEQVDHILFLIAKAWRMLRDLNMVVSTRNKITNTNVLDYLDNYLSSEDIVDGNWCLGFQRWQIRSADDLSGILGDWEKELKNLGKTEQTAIVYELCRLTGWFRSDWNLVFAVMDGKINLLTDNNHIVL